MSDLATEFAWDEFLGTVLSDAEIKDLLQDENTPDEIFPIAVRSWIAQIQFPAQGSMHWKERSKVRYVFEHPRLQDENGLVMLLPLIAKALSDSELLRAARTYLHQVPLSALSLDALVVEVLSADTPADSKVGIAVVLADRIVSLFKEDANRQDPLCSHYSDAMRRILLATREQDAFEESWKIAFTYCFVVLSWLPLPWMIDLALEADFRWQEDVAPAVHHSEVWSDDRIEQLLALESPVVDYHITQNPRLTAAVATRIFERYVTRDPAMIARIAAHLPAFMVQIDQEEGAAFLRHIAEVRFESGLPVSDEMAADILQGMLAAPEPGDAPLARWLYLQLGDPAGAALVSTGVDAIAAIVHRHWLKKPIAGRTLAALLSYPRKEIRRLLVPAGGLFALEALGRDGYLLFVREILPRLEQDRSLEIRLRAGDLLRLARQRPMIEFD